MELKTDIIAGLRSDSSPAEKNNAATSYGTLTSEFDYFKHGVFS